MTFGINSTDLESTGGVLGKALGVTFILHESDSRGGDYCRATTSEGTIFLQRNRDLLDDDDEPFEPLWPVDQLIMYFDKLNAGELETYTERIRRLDASFVVELK